MKKALFAMTLGLAVLGTAALSMEQGGSEVQTTTYDLGKIPSVDVKSLQGKDLKVRLENGAYKLLSPIRFEDLAPTEKAAGGGTRMFVSYQLGTVNDLPFVITINAPTGSAAGGKDFVKEVETPAEKLLAALDTSSIFDTQKCVGEKACTKTCTKNGKEYCCEWRCK